MLEVYIEGIGQKRVEDWISLPITEKEMDAILIKVTGSENGLEYILSDYDCPYFEISEQEDIRLLNKTAKIIQQMGYKEQILLKSWCMVHEQGMADLAEICSAALQIKKIRYADTIKSYEDLGRYIVKKDSEISEKISRIIEKELGVSGEEYLDYENIGRDYMRHHPGVYFAVDFEKNTIGLIWDDSKVDEFLYSRDTIMNMSAIDLEKILAHEIEKSNMEKCMEKTAEEKRVIYKERERER